MAVLDLNNWRNGQGEGFQVPPQAWEEDELRRQVDVLQRLFPAQIPLVVYVAGRRDYLDEVGKVRLLAPTNNAVTLVGMVVDAAYLVHGHR